MPLTFSKGVVSGWGDTRRPGTHRGGIPLPEPGGCSRAGCPASPSLLRLSPGTAVRWVHQAGGDWSRNAAELAPGTRSPDLTNASSAEAGPAPLDMIGTLPVTSSDAKVPLQLIMAKTRHKNLRTAMRYIKPGGEAVAEITGILGPSRRKH